MTLQIILGSIVSLIGIGSSFLGILFFIASKSDDSRLVVGIILLVTGLPIFWFGFMKFRKGMSLTPSAIKKSLLKLATRNHGEVTRETILGELGDSDVVNFQIHELLSAGIARETTKAGRSLLVFPDFYLELVVKQCPYCGNDYPVRDVVENCPNCGGDLKMHKNRLAHTEEKFSMDDGDDSGTG